MGNTNVRSPKEHSGIDPGVPNSHGAAGQSVHGGDPGRLGAMAYGESMLQSPPDSPSSVSRSPLMFTPQIPMVPIAKADEFTLGPYQPGMYEHHGHEMMQQERGIPTMIVWSHGGNNVAVEGSWDNWTTREPLQKAGKDFTIVKILQSGVYQYRIILDKDWNYPHEVLSKVNNVLDVQDYVPENLDSVAGFEPPQSPTSSYNDTFPTPEDFSKEPPILPSHLHLTLLNVPPLEETSGALPRPQHVTLNHLYVEKGKNLRSVLALGLTHRYRSKYVTVALYKPVHK
ncbi:5'-AMP-activated protein kinase, regulatory beta subunit [Marchantia polymorpha subsp. ruderalis]|nr:hypothetical protein MARPO_0002s0309 [Marchantia polymorpha]BBN00004.1 hypothetical protein Mp_1g25620 [Marchantia polymorpha subsp. ruderalis]|eukprot:PTQ49874.1 hypothetical protein MARPO_0002s0309 [Marchantia polymorpha]